MMMPTVMSLAVFFTAALLETPSRSLQQFPEFEPLTMPPFVEFNVIAHECMFRRDTWNLQQE
eukprot:219639-Karenia_brevis.AAC.1